MAQQENTPLNFFEKLSDIKNHLAGKAIVIFLDYDGTLTPIVDTPDRAIISDEMRATVRRLAEHHKVSVVSGRGTDDVRVKVGIDGIFYAGSHGFEIVTPSGDVKVNHAAQAIRPTIDRTHKELNEKLGDVSGALVEHVKYTISVHYRLVSDKDFARIREAVDEVLRKHPDLRKTEGKKVFEVRPRIDWDKGKAVEWILKVLDFDGSREAALYIGDDTTDEDAFRVLSGRGFGILVSEKPRGSAAQYMIKNTEDVQRVLEGFIQLKESHR